MLDSLRGAVVSSNRDSVILESLGVGVRLRVPKGSVESLEVGTDTRLFCHLLLRDEQFQLFGFQTQLERDVFLVLLGVAGLGPEKALALLGGMSPAAIAAAVRDDSHHQFEVIKGIGARLAKRIALELKGKLDDLAVGVPAAPDAGAPGELASDVISTLTNLGYSRSVAEQTANRVVAASRPDAPIEELLKAALRSLQNPAPP